MTIIGVSVLYKRVSIHWTGLLKWTTGLDYWTTGLDYCPGLLDSTKLQNIRRSVQNRR